MKSCGTPLHTNNLRALIKNDGYTYKEIAEETGIPLGSLYHYLRGDCSIPHERQCTLASVIGCSVEAIVTRNKQHATPSVQWGKITLYLDHEAFQKGYVFGREMYFDHAEYDYRTRAKWMTSLDAAGTVADCPLSTGTYHFDEKTYDGGPLEILGAFLGYMSGPLYPETPEERKARDQHWCSLPG